MTHIEVDDEPRSPSDSATSDGNAPRRSGLWIGSAIAIVAVLALLAGTVFALLTHMDGAGEQSPSQPNAGGSSSDGSRPVPAETPAAALAAPRPTDCQQIYSAEMLASLQATGLPLNDGSVADSLGTTDPELADVIAQNSTFKCSWGSAGEYGLNTNITQVSTESSTVVLDRLSALGFECSTESQGTRCVQSETVTDELGTYRAGESHFVRGGVWVATHWINFAPTGYTQDIVASLWPAE
ncbi:hypothetical protein CLV49_0380 [Labedella gwakjiensis]|uniref:Uncharacterized protein n=1 Tax=Labedella gwakjiensis TaxID=390269 RepID=A0A2P8GS54_9MICO|nr:hypothetical protein [Labedella gwakjiensis]PSL36782.1 hypothetical protein CLV49_0380 [Labedella gwakjiensis]RUQ84292.1 hypothetical protein ELQ93_15880 [Labedella gwakjiensis]